MNLLLKLINDNLTNSPFKVQMAVNRQWENAWKINLDNFNFSESKIKKFVKKNTKIVATELFYKTKDKRDFYIGIQFHPDLKKTKNPYSFLKTYLNTLRDLKDKSFPSVLNSLGLNLHGNKETFLTQEPSLIVMGIVDWWMTFGPCRIWKKGEEKVISAQILNGKLNGHNNLVLNNKNYPGLEFVYNYVPKYWISFQAGEKNGAMFKLDTSYVVDLLKKLLNFKRA